MRIVPLFLVCLASLTFFSSASTQSIFESYGQQHPVFFNETYHSGFLPNDNEGDLFYILFDSRNNVETDPLVLWLTGGPGCSSELAMFTENGPFTIDQNDLSLSINPYSWNNKANLLYVDQPAGTGFSTVVNYDSTEWEVARDFYNFFMHFLEAYPQFKGRDFYITGESFAGHYIPVVASYFLQQKNSDINIQGIAIGNGWVEPLYQYPAYPLYAYENGLIDQEKYEQLSAKIGGCQEAILASDPVSTVVQCTGLYSGPVGPRTWNIYDIRIPCIGSLCYDLSFVDRFLAKPEVREALGVVGRSWSECNHQVHKFFNLDHEVGYSSYVGELLDLNVPVLVYSGVEDFICNYRGNEAWTNALQYSGHDEFENAEYVPFGKHGLYKSAKGLTFFKMLDAGHLVPMDQPAAALKMLHAFIDGKFDN